MTPKEYLSQYRTLDVEINSKLEQVAQLRALASKVSPSTGFGAAGGISDRVGKTVAKIVDLENEINDDIDKLVELKREIRHILNSIPNSTYRNVLEMRYFLGMDWEEIGEKIGYSPRQTIRFHGYALVLIEKMSQFVLECHGKSVYNDIVR